MGEMAAEIAARMREDGIDTSQTPEAAMGGAPAPGTGGSGSPQQAAPSAGTQNTDTQPTGGEPGPIPYSRFAEVNAEKNALQERWGVLDTYGIEPDSAVRLAQFEAAYMQDPSGTISAMVDQLDLPDSRKATLKELLASEAVPAESGEPDPGEAQPLSDEVKEALGYVNALRAREQQAASQQRLDFVLNHWRSLDGQDSVEFPDRVRLQYVSTAAAQGGFQTLEQLAEAARRMALEDRDIVLGGAIRRPSAGAPLAVPAGGAPPTQAVVPKTMADARKLIEADIAAGRLPDLQTPGG